MSVAYPIASRIVLLLERPFVPAKEHELGAVLGTVSKFLYAAEGTIMR